MLWLQSLNLDYAFWFTIFAIFILLLMSAFFSGSETALTAASRGKLQTQADLAASTNDPEQAWKLEIWTKMLARIRKMQTMMDGESQPKS